jgi:hypothetical protein
VANPRARGTDGEDVRLLDSQAAGSGVSFSILMSPPTVALCLRSSRSMGSTVTRSPSTSSFARSWWGELAGPLQPRATLKSMDDRPWATG